MRICVLHSSFKGARSDFEGLDQYPDPSGYTDQHVFEHRFITKANYQEELNFAAAESFDLYFNFMWGQPEDEVAGVDATRYVEQALRLPVIGISSRILERSKTEFYDAARRTGKPSVPGVDKFPKIIKPARGCGSQFLTGKSLCNTQEELDSAIAELNEKLAPGRAIANGHKASILKRGDHQLPDDIVIQEYVEGSDFSCAVVEMGNTPVALPPMIWRYPEDAKDQFLSWDVKWHPETHEEVFPRSENPSLFDSIRKTAEEAFYTNEMHGCSWCNVDLRVGDNGTITVIEVNPMPPIFQVGYKSADTVIEKFFPGGHKALLNSAIANFFLRNTSRLETVRRVAATYDAFAGGYDMSVTEQASEIKNIRDLATKYAYDGVVLDLGCGTGLIGRQHGEKNGAEKTTFIGVDISSKMRDVCLEHKTYQAVIIGPVQKILMVYPRPVDHIVCTSALHFLSTYELSMVLSRSFQLARSSVTFGVEEIPSVYNDTLKTKGLHHMESLDHLAGVEAFGTPAGWKLVDRWRRFGWISPNTGAEVYTSVFRFEREDRESFHWFMPESASKLPIIEPNTETNVVADLDGDKAQGNADINEILLPSMNAPTQIVSA
ncbi:hypothetical protein V495_02890 [Pseudogymnoascus sp. VKM F-4514 (FW-929)]|nr:hypothetical protein V495_02890 [Pseudogymnoascus sp. VKM F-4514 (FW-929)]KFY62059.1 hypothetical protein V497_02598 [Pseudogymnoascus sp. VKM F-4516 (FW-969)]